MHSKPLLAKINEDYPKLKQVQNVQEFDSLINYLVTLLNIKCSNQEEADDLKIQMLVVKDFLKSKFGNLTIEEIKEAFKMYAAREFENIKVFRLLDCISIGEVLQAYIDFRNESLRGYNSQKQNLLNTMPEKTTEEKKEIRLQFIKMLYDEIKTDKFSKNAWLLYNDLFTSGKIKITEEEKKALYNEQLLIYATEQRTEINKKNNLITKPLLLDLNTKIQSGKPIELVKNKCKNVLVSNYLKKNMYDFETFKNSILE